MYPQVFNPSTASVPTNSDFSFNKHYQESKGQFAHREDRASMSTRPEWNNTEFYLSNEPFEDRIIREKPAESAYGWVPLSDKNGTISSFEIDRHQSAGWTVVPSSRHATSIPRNDMVMNQIYNAVANREFSAKNNLMSDFETYAIINNNSILMEKNIDLQNYYDQNVNKQFKSLYEEYGPNGTGNVNGARGTRVGNMTYKKELIPII